MTANQKVGRRSVPVFHPANGKVGKFPPLVQEALQVTWTLKGHLKNAQLSYLRVGLLLARVRDEKLYDVLHHPDLEAYASERLRLQPSTLHGYLQVLAWVQANHPEWLQPKPKGYIPNLTRATALIW